MYHNESSAEFLSLREKAGLSIDETANLIGRTARTVRRYEAKDKTQSEPPVLVIEKLRDYIEKRCRQDETSEKKFRFIDLFAGIGGLRIPFEELDGQCVFTAEWDRFARETYAANFKDDESHQFAGDIRPYAENPELIPQHDVLLAGFPCQPFSIAGVSKKNSLGKPHGFMCDTQGTLFYDLAKIIEHHKPSVFLLENVKNLERHDGGRTFKTIMHVLEKELGYEVHKKVISSHPWVPQKRERIFIVGFRSRSLFDFDDFEIPETDQPVLGDILDSDIPDKYTLTEKLWAYLQNYKKKHQKAGNGFGFSLFNSNDVTRTLSARYYKDGSEILINQGKKRPRRLTPRECARLMGFDKPDSSDFIIPVSDTQAYRQFGNAVVVPVVRDVAQLMKPHIEKALAVQDQEQFQQELQLRKKRA
ncbi:DNA (cytosine-5-)-methyltransferase [Kiloniella sp. EL199]|uniref:DNA (cytosine-5-)-methyltransferase n=1 Tax=Kiloniella sp. EL199 TaxID=2107581 RepID=UPI000EA27B61|nr:DNA (cytosine-5-)-methyltransferase [Kiloniella sp. EL199]